jgi:DNA-binding GntR family transcriptional regulator
LISNDPLSASLTRRIADEVYQRLREAIITGHLKPGARVIERDLTDRLQVSRTPIREALKQLEQEWLVVGYPHKGYFVRSPSYDEARQVYELRREAEGLSAQLAAERITDEELAAMSEAIHKSGVALNNGDLHYIPVYNNEFHLVQAQAARNTFLLQELQKLWAYVNVMRPRYWLSTNRAAESHVEHQQILTAVQRHDGFEARRLSQEHIERAWRLVAEQFTVGPSR